jgi:hypothetical protein
MNTKYILLLFISCFLFVACEKDNYDPPATEFVGKLSYNGKPVPWNGNTETPAEAEIIQLYQDGFGKYAPINVRVTDDGTFKALLFNGEYKMIMRNMQYPFVFESWPLNANGGLDTIYFTLNGKKEMDINVKPYFEINDIKSAVEGTNIVTTFNLNEVVPGAKVRAVYAYLHPTISVNKGTPLNQKLENIDVSKPISIKIGVSSYRSRYINNFREYGFLRIAVELDKATEYMWSEIIQVDGIPVTLNDVTKEYIKNPGPPIKKIASDTRPGDVISTPADWIVNDAVKIFDGYGGLDARWGRNTIGAIKDSPGDLRNGKVYQTITLPAGTYEFSLGTAGFYETWNGRDDEGFIVVAKGNTIPDYETFKTTSLGWTDFNGFRQTAVAFNLTEETTVSLGFLFNFIGATNGRGGVAFFAPSVQLIKAD